MQAYGGVLGIEATCKNAVGVIESGPPPASSVRAFWASISARKIFSPPIWAARLSKSAWCAMGQSSATTAVILRYNILSTKIWVNPSVPRRSIAWMIQRQAAQSRTSGSRRSAGAGLLRYRWQRADGLRCRSGARLFKREYFLGGRMKLNKAKTLTAMREKIAQPLKMSEVEAASGIYRIANRI